MKKKVTLLSLITIIVIFFLAGNTHRILPTANDPCQIDMTHKDHINELPMFHCIGHTEYEVNPEEKGVLRVKKWDHIHSWMTLEWHLQQGFTKEHALELISISQE
jgi:hypothetical protein